MTIMEVVGTVGLLVLVIALALNLKKKVTSDSILYNLLNAVGGGCLFVNALYLKSWNFVVLEVIWTVLSISQLLKRK